MQQTAFSWDSVTVQKTLRGFLISIGGALLAGFVLLVPEVSDYIASDDPIRWRDILLAFWGAFSSGLINAGKQWLSGVDK